MTDRKAAPISIQDVGALFTSDGRDCWKLVSINDSEGPVLHMEKMLPDQENEAKGAPSDFARYMRLVPEIPPKRAYNRQPRRERLDDEGAT